MRLVHSFLSIELANLWAFGSHCTLILLITSLISICLWVPPVSWLNFGLLYSSHVATKCDSVCLVQFTASCSCLAKISAIDTVVWRIVIGDGILLIVQVLLNGPELLALQARRVYSWLLRLSCREYGLHLNIVLDGCHFILQSLLRLDKTLLVLLDCLYLTSQV